MDGRATVGWEWRDARRWDLGHPELYVLDLRVRGTGLDDAWRETFGFREVWIDGRDIWLNGSIVRLRPFSLSNEDDQNWGMGELVDGAITGIQGAGFDTLELWPWDQAERGSPLWHDLWCERARARGLGLVLPLQSITQLRPRWQEPAVRAAWERTVAAQIRRQRNNPAVLMWVHTANNWGFEDDQDPRVILDGAVRGGRCEVGGCVTSGYDVDRVHQTDDRPDPRKGVLLLLPPPTSDLPLRCLG